MIERALDLALLAARTWDKMKWCACWECACGLEVALIRKDVVHMHIVRRQGGLRQVITRLSFAVKG